MDRVAEVEEPARRRYLLWVLAGFVIAGLITALVFVVAGGDDTEQANRPTPTTASPLVTTAPKTTTSAPPTQLVAPTISTFDVTCDPGPSEPLCTLTLTWADHASGETGYRVSTTSQVQGGAPTEWDLPANATSWTQPWNSGDNVCVRVGALGPTPQSASSGEECRSTGIG
jgi:hypothetical protein